MKPTKGTVETYGSIAPLIELGAGFDPELSAVENIYLNGAVLGYSHAYMEERVDSIRILPSWRNSATSPSKTFLPA